MKPSLNRLGCVKLESEILPHDTITSSMQSEDVAETVELPGRFLNEFTVSEPKFKVVGSQKKSRLPAEETEETQFHAKPAESSMTEYASIPRF